MLFEAKCTNEGASTHAKDLETRILNLRMGIRQAATDAMNETNCENGLETGPDVLTSWADL